MKTCPICRSGTFDDAAICFGCLYRFEEDEDPALRDEVGASESGKASIEREGAAIGWEKIPADRKEAVREIEGAKPGDPAFGGCQGKESPAERGPACGVALSAAEAIGATQESGQSRLLADGGANSATLLIAVQVMQQDGMPLEWRCSVGGKAWDAVSKL